MPVLWAPWRMAYVAGPKDTRCFFCAVPPATSEWPDALVVAATPAVLVMLNRFPYANGHLMVAPREHCGDLHQLAVDQFRAIMDAVRYSARVLQTVFNPQGMNIGINLGHAAGAGVADHHHRHHVPRWVGDVNYMPMLAEVRVIPEHLATTYERLRPHFAGLMGAPRQA
jgi:ATP adenylyltransferase